MKLWEDKKTIENICRISGWQRIRRSLEFTNFAYRVMENGIRSRLKKTSKKKVLELIKKMLRESE